MNNTFKHRTLTAGNQTKNIERSFDVPGRMRGNDGSVYEYVSAGKIVSIFNSIALAGYTMARLDAVYVLTRSSCVSFTRNIARDAYRRSLVTGIESSVGSNVIESRAYSYDALNRPTMRNNDSFGYNARSEVTAANVSGFHTAYGYDFISNSTNWTVNCLNQYSQFVHNIDGNMLSDGYLLFTYDAANRLKTVSSNGVLLVTNFYDAKSLRVKKMTPEATTTFFYDGWNLIEERVAYTNGTTSTIRYYWGKDLSGTLQGAGGVGGLLYLAVDSTIYVPFYDNNGNITRYLDSSGNTVAQYTYDAFGNTISQSGPLADFFRHRFSTKYFDAETGLYYYGYRFYHPALMRWLTRDPLEEAGGLNLYAICMTNPILHNDTLGLNIFDDIADGIANGIIEYAKFIIEARKFWKSVADGYFRPRGMEFSAQFLEHSLQNYPKPLHFKQNDPLTLKVRKSKAYQSFLGGIISRQRERVAKYDGSKKLGIRLTDHDLLLAIDHASISLSGKICKNKRGKAKLMLNVTIEDDYDFHWHNFSDGEKQFVTLGNNAAYISQIGLIITPYHIDIKFKERGIRDAKSK